MTFMLIVFLMKIASAGACFSHELAEAGFAGLQEQSSSMQSSPDTGDAISLEQSLLSHAGGCNHCGCHHAAAVVAMGNFSPAVNLQEPGELVPALSPSVAPREDLRPPIS